MELAIYAVVSLSFAATGAAVGWLLHARRGAYPSRQNAAPGGPDLAAQALGVAELESAVDAVAKAQAASVAKSRFLATMSHEIRTPLNGVLGMADLLADTPLDPEQRNYVEAIRSSGQALASLIDEILDLSRIESGRLELVEAPFDLVTLLESAAELLAPRAQDKGLEIATSVAPGLPRALAGDAARIRQVVLNMASNAIKFTQTGGVGIRAQPAHDHVVAFGHVEPHGDVSVIARFRGVGDDELPTARERAQHQWRGRGNDVEELPTCPEVFKSVDVLLKKGNEHTDELRLPGIIRASEAESMIRTITLSAGGVQERSRSTPAVATIAWRGLEVAPRRAVLEVLRGNGSPSDVDIEVTGPEGARHEIEPLL